MALKLDKINNHRVRAIPLPHLDTRPVKGADLIKKAFGTIFSVAHRESGKTTVLFHLLKHCISKKTHVIIFCSTLYNDENWVAIRRYLKKQGNPTDFYTSIYEDGINLIQEWVDKLSAEAKERDEKEDKEKEDEPSQTDAILAYFNRHNLTDEKPKKERKEKYKAPKYFLIFDDISAELKTPPIIKLLQEGRHFFAKTFISSQYLKNLVPASREQIEVWILFKDIPDDKIQEVHEATQLRMPFEQFLEAYKLATKVTKKEPYPFFYVDKCSKDLRRCFNRRITFEKENDDKD